MAKKTGVGRRKTSRVVTLKLKKCPNGRDGCQWKYMQFKVILLSKKQKTKKKLLSPGAAVKNGSCSVRYRFTEHKWNSVPLVKKLG